MQDSNQPDQLQRLARMLNFCALQVYQLCFPESEQKGSEQTEQMRVRLCCSHAAMSGFLLTLPLFKTISVTALFTHWLGLLMTRATSVIDNCIYKLWHDWIKSEANT